VSPPEVHRAPWSDAYIYNTIEAICLALAIDPEATRNWPRPRMRSARSWTSGFPRAGAQSDDGYIHSFHVVNKIDRYTNINNHEFYVQAISSRRAWPITWSQAGRIAGCTMRLGSARTNCARRSAGAEASLGPRASGMEIALCRLGRLVNQVEGAGRGDKYVELVRFLYDTRASVAEHRSAYRSPRAAVEQTERWVTPCARRTSMPVWLTSPCCKATAPFERGGQDLGQRRSAEALSDRRRRRVPSRRGVRDDFDLRNDGYCESCAGCACPSGRTACTGCTTTRTT